MTRSFPHWLLAVLACAATGIAHAQPGTAFPIKPIRMVVPFAAGGSNDVIARLIGPRLTESFGQQVLVDNRPGAGSVIGSEIVARAPGDGYTLLLADAALGFALAVQGRQVYDPVKDFSPITLIGTAPMMLLVNTQVPVQSLKDSQVHTFVQVRYRPSPASHESPGAHSPDPFSHCAPAAGVQEA